ncbi:MAG: amidohydrolase family protein, partial [Firmicutes bacterium]|nr:amidohydrolase family protein [Bacillota bacterium]
PDTNHSGTLAEGIALWHERKKTLRIDEVTARAKEAIRRHIAHGVLYLRSHVDVTDPSLTALRALLALKKELPAGMVLQLVAFPQDGIFGVDHGPELMEEAMRLGADVVGGIPHYEWTREEGVQDVRFAFDLARKYHALVDIHCDETDDDQSRFTETMAKLTWDWHWAGRVTASHATAMGSYNDAYAAKLIRLIKTAGMHIVANPLDNIVLQGRYDSYPKRRGMTRVKELLQAGVVVAAGHDSIQDPWYPWGTANPLFVAAMLAHIGHLTGSDDVPDVLATVMNNAARVMRLADYPLIIQEGQPASFVVYTVPTLDDLLRLMPKPRWVMAKGQLLAETVPEKTHVAWTDNVWQSVKFF